MPSKTPVSRVVVGIVMGVALGVVLHEATKVQNVSLKGEGVNWASLAVDAVTEVLNTVNSATSSAPAYAAYCCGHGAGNGGCMQIFDPSQASTYCDLNKYALIPYTVEGFAICQSVCNNTASQPTTPTPPPPTTPSPTSSSAPGAGWCCVKPSNTCVAIPPSSSPPNGACNFNGEGCTDNSYCCSGNCVGGMCKPPGAT
jgi:hypothetical protein